MTRGAACCLLVALAGCTQRADLLADNAATRCAASGAAPALGAVGCPSALAAGLFDRAACVCGDVSLPGALFARRPAPAPPSPPPPVAVSGNGGLAVADTVQLFGGLTAAGGPLRLGATAAVLGDVRAGGDVAVTQLLSVAGDLYAAGDLSGRMEVEGNVFVPWTATVPPTVASRGVRRLPVAIAPPCACDARAVDAAVVAHARAAANDDHAIGLGAAALAAVTDGAALDLPCGAYYVTGIAGASLQLRVHGKAALFVDGDVALAGELQATLDPAAELDLVVAGDVRAAAITGATPAATRVWIGGRQLRVGTGAVAGLVYAPAATVASDGTLAVDGALFVGGLQVGGDVDIRFVPPAATCN